MKRIAALIFGITLAALFTGCSDQGAAEKESSEPAKQEEKKEKEEAAEKVNYPEAAMTGEEIVKQPVGEKMAEAVAKAGSAEEESISDMDKLMEEFQTKEQSNQEIFNGLVHWFGMDYTEVYQNLVNYEPDYGEYDIAGEKQKTKNIAIHIDSSGSMNGQVSGGVKMDLAKNAVKKFAAGFPDNTPITLRTYGHKGTGNDKDKQLSCSSTEVMYETNTYNEQNFSAALNKFKPSGWTPIAASIKAGYDDLKTKAAENTENILYVVSDGIETCDGDPVEEARKLANSDLKVKVNIIGFNVDDEGQRQLKAAAEAGNGQYYTVNSKVELENTLNKLMGEAMSSIEKNIAKATSITDINFRSSDLYEKVRGLERKLTDVAFAEKDLMGMALSELAKQEKIKPEEREAIQQLIDDRYEEMLSFGETLTKQAHEKVDQKRQELINQISAS
ncbi:VWA domain-containing protein [Mesobacillus subterraneus]|uniref:VWA domain-containing protein n=1 Tax=Mesobacillus subterraneus TaxID=285983 RepID=UPI00203FA868|nr:VWA domain-containing protein [Mesobacillus subterraneus]MCM3576020.1 VWA domain-containing protein [Mesobacillus subterraneus]